MLSSLLNFFNKSSLSLAQKLTTAKSNEIHQFEIADILKEDEEGEYKGCNALWHLARAGDYSSLMGLWDMYKNQIPLQALIKEASDEKHKGKSVLWWLSSCNDKRVINDFLDFWVHFNGLPLECLTKVVEGRSILCNLLLKDNDSKFFMLVWEKYAEQIPLETIKLLLVYCSHNFNESFKVIWRNYSTQISLEDLLKPSKIENYQKISVLWNLVWAYKENVPGALEILKDILTRLPGQIPNNFLTLQPLVDINKNCYTLLELLNLKGVSRENNSFNFKLLIETRNNFYQALKEQNYDAAFESAKLAQEAGYPHAFFELGEALLNIDFEKAIQAYLKIPETSPRYEASNLKLANHCYMLATDAQNSEIIRHKYLRLALTFALKTKDEDRAALLQNIAFAHITKGQQKGLGDEIKLVRAWWFETMNGETPIDWCFERFEEAAKEEELKKENTRLKREVALIKVEDNRKEEEIKKLREANASLQKVIVGLMQKEETVTEDLLNKGEKPLVFSLAATSQTCKAVPSSAPAHPEEETRQTLATSPS